jgi:CheY-like chemotaxis protein
MGRFSYRYCRSGVHGQSPYLWRIFAWRTCRRGCSQPAGERVFVIWTTKLLLTLLHTWPQPFDRGAFSVIPNTALIVDDDSGTRSLLRLILEIEGYAVVEAAHGEAALGMISPGLVPDVILTDIAMPVLNGVQLIERLQSEPRTAAIPIVVVSAWDETQALEASGQVAAVLRKPFDPLALAACIRGLATPQTKTAPAA